MNGWRHYLLLLGFAGAVLALMGRVGFLAVSERDFLARQGDARSVRVETVEAYRGGIYDRHGEVLALSTPVQAAWTDPSRFQFGKQQLDAMALVLQEEPRRLGFLLQKGRQKGRQFVYLKRQLSDAQVQALRALEIDGLFLRTEYRRFYPAAEVAAHVVGKTSVDDLGLEGVELAFNDLLVGQPGRRTVLKDRRGALIDVLDYGKHASTGGDLTLGIDLRLQYLAYRELKTAVQEQQASTASLVMVDVKTGEVLALVNQPSYNPNDALPPGYVGQRNIAATDTFEPGSTVKPFTVLAALESGAYSAGSLIETSPGFISVDGKLIADPVDRGAVTLARALAASSQVAIAKVALALPPTAVFDALSRAGMATFIGTGLPGEAAGSLPDRVLDRPLARAVLAYGYGLAASPLQLAQAYLTLATGGVHLPLSIVKRSAVPAGTRVFAEDDVAAVLRMMEGVVAADGTAPQAALSGYRVAGKTGTARKLRDGSYLDERHVALFAGIAPVTDPRIVVVVVVDEPRTERASGSASAAPVFARVADQALKLLGAETDGRS